MQSVEQIGVWRLAMSVAHDVYDLSARFPDEERYGVTRQIRRACVSIAANIAEGVGRGTDRETRRFLFIALGSLEETFTFCAFAAQRGWIDRGDRVAVAGRLNVLRRRILAFIRRLPDPRPH